MEPSRWARDRCIGATIGAASGPASAYAAVWGGLGDAGPHVAVIATILAALLGASTWPVFVREPEALQRPPIRFAALFAGSVGLVAGAFAAFPLGGVGGAWGGAVAGAVSAFGCRRAQGPWAMMLVWLAGALSGILVLAIGLNI